MAAGRGDEEVKAAPESTGSVPLSLERRRLLASAWETTSRGLRAMDDLELGETEPATIYVWEER